MKTSRTLILTGTALIAGFLLARLSAAQPTNSPPSKEPAGYDFGALQQLTSFVTYLQDTKQTNTLQRFHEYINSSLTSQHGADIGMDLHILENLRTGRTNQAYELLEGRLDAEIIGFVASYRELPAWAKKLPGLKVLEDAKYYRTKFPFKHKYQNVDDGVAEAFKILDEKAK